MLDIYSTGNPSPAGGHQVGHRADGGRYADLENVAYHWTHQKQPDSGAMEWAFQSLLLPEQSVIDHAVCVRKGVSVFAGMPQLYVPAVSVPTAGLGGLVTGQMVMQPLYDPYSKSYAGN